MFDDAAIDQAVEGIVNGIFFNQGHVCCAGSRLLLQESVAEEVIEKLWRRMGLLRVGDPLDKNTDVGAINSAAQLQRIEALVDAGEREGATRRTVACALPERGYWFPPTLFTDVAPAHRIAVEEIFGPVVSVLTFRTQAEAIEKANASAYGLAAGVWTDKGSRALAVARGLKAGVVWQNTYNQFDPTSPFGGYKESGFGREGGAAGLRPYVRMRDEPRLPVAKTYKLYVGGAFVRSESGRHLAADRPRGQPRRQRAARHAQGRARRRPRRPRRAAGLAGPHRLQPRPDPLPVRRGAGVARPTSWRARPRACAGSSAAAARAEIEAAVDHAVHYAGWTDKLHAVLGTVNPVAAPHFNFTFPEPTGVVGVIAPDEPDVLGLVAEILPPLAAGNVVVAIVSERWPLLPLHLGEVLGVADVPAGVVNLLSGLRSELVKPLAGHRDVDAIIDTTGDPEVVAPRRRQRHARGAPAGDDYLDVAGPRQPLADRAVRRAQDRLAPRRHVGSPRVAAQAPAKPSPGARARIAADPWRRRAQPAGSCCRPARTRPRPWPARLRTTEKLYARLDADDRARIQCGDRARSGVVGAVGRHRRTAATTWSSHTGCEPAVPGVRREDEAQRRRAAGRRACDDAQRARDREGRSTTPIWSSRRSTEVRREVTAWPRAGLRPRSAGRAGPVLDAVVPAVAWPASTPHERGRSPGRASTCSGRVAGQPRGAAAPYNAGLFDFVYAISIWSRFDEEPALRLARGAGADHPARRPLRVTVQSHQSLRLLRPGRASRSRDERAAHAR